MLKNWLKIYWYNTMKHKMYFLLTVVGLTLGIASVVLASLYYLEESSYDQWNPNKDEVYLVETVAPNFSMTDQFRPMGRYLKDNYKELDDYMYYGYNGSLNFIYNEKKIDAKDIYAVQDNYFEFFPFEFVYGNAEKALVNPNDVAIDIKISEALFGEGVNPIGKTIEAINPDYDSQGNTNFIISGVYKIGDLRSSFAPNAVMNNLTEKPSESDDWGDFGLILCVKTKQPDRIKKAIMELRDKYVAIPNAKKDGLTLEQYKEEEPFKYYTGDIVLNKLADARMLPNQRLFPEGSANVQMLNISIFLSMTILLLSIFNYVNLSLTQVVSRGKEIGMRRVAGAGKRSFYQQSIFETAIVVIFSLVLAICIIELILPYINVYLETNITFSFINDLAVLIVIATLVVLICGGIPAFFVSRFETVKLLKGNVIGTKGGKWLSNGFLVLQFTIACFFIIGSIIVNEQVSYMLNKSLGFKGDQVINIEFLSSSKYTGKRAIKYASFKAELEKIKGIESISTSNVSFVGNRGGVFGTYHNNGKENVMINNAMIDYDFFDALEIKLKEGRMLSAQLSSDSLDNVVVNETFVHTMNLAKPLDTPIELLGKKKTIVGVIQDFNVEGLEEKILPFVYSYMPETKHSYGMYSVIYIKIVPEYFSKTIVDIEKLWKQYNIEERDVFQYKFVDKQFAETFHKVQMEKRIFNILSIVVVFIALFGLFAVSSFTIGTKLREVAIRKVLGADTFGLLRQLSFQYVIYCLVGFGIAVFPSYYFLNKWLENYAYRIEIGWSVYAYSLLLILGLTLLIVISRAYKATRVDVLKYIKYE
ncbi:ABC transporter permease [Myroides profundi]|uniref:ABC transport system permease protein n=1 Tax=Myroides profundi TaxID=480520 RepID=A0AAJ4W3Q2_MYRPR|nr:ABC transporter permease [Myroides profundi]AJH16548.1 putative ABC transport system permease protein [Myroides profundi]SEQ82714.1 putative ABC transport system permease protein [Myroides profundi]